MPGEMLPARRHAVLLQPVDDGRPEASDALGVFTEGAVTDDGVLRIGMNVENRGVVERNAHSSELGCQSGRKTAGELNVTAPPQHSHRRPFGERRLQPRDASALLIDADPERQIGRQLLHID